MGGGRAACAAAFELIRWAEGTNLKIKRVDKAAISTEGSRAESGASKTR